MHGVGTGKYWEEKDITSDESGKRLKWRCEDGVERNIGCTDGKWRRFTAGLGDIGSTLWPGHVERSCEVLVVEE